MGILLIGLAVQWSRLLNHDVAWFAWGARQLTHGSVIGVDLLDPNFPLAFIIYLPAVAIGEAVNLAEAVKIWTVCLAGMSIALILPDVEQDRGSWLAIIVAGFTAFAMPREFGQREQLAMLLVLPYLIPTDRSGPRAILIGALAALGFALKPHFLIAWMLIEIGRPFWRVEQRMLIVTGLFYALLLPIAFHDFLFRMLPITLDLYGAFDRADVWQKMIPSGATGIAALALSFICRDALARAFAIAAMGFWIAAVVQLKFYPYHFLPVWAFSLGSLVACVAVADRLIRYAGLSLVAGAILALAQLAIPWWVDRERREENRPEFRSALAKAKTFTAISVHPYPAFPTALDVENEGVRYIGVANSHWFLPAAALGNQHAEALARRQALRDLSQRPDIVLIDRKWLRHTRRGGPAFDGLTFLMADAGVAMMLREYEFVGSVDEYRVLRHRKADNHPLDGAGI